VLVGALGAPPIPANLAAVLLCSVVNFVGSDRAVFGADVGRAVNDGS
jgi:hypothetical protein